VFFALVLTQGDVMRAGGWAIGGGLAFALLPELGMFIVACAFCTPVVLAQCVVGLPSLAVWLAITAAVALAPLVVGGAVFFAIRRGFGDAAALFFLIVFLTAWIAGRRLHKRAISTTSKTTEALLRLFNDPIDRLRVATFKYFNELGRWIAQ